VVGVIILGIETATMQASCAIGGQEGVLASFSAARGPRHSEVLAPGIEFICKQARIDLQEVTVVAVDIGPGLFTGLRVGIATAKAIAQALRVPMIGLPSLDLLAFPLRHTDRLIVPVIDARRGEVYTASYRRVPGGVQRLTEPRVCSPAELAAELSVHREETLLIGDGVTRHHAIFDELRPHAEHAVDHCYPSAAALVQLAQPLALREEFVLPAELAPMYIRKPDAEPTWQNRTSNVWARTGGGA
jgi:tRNA threonylcarbamoyladenosine biosynthesis protein TsaB